MKKAVIGLAFMMLFGCGGHAQTKSMTGTVVERSAGNSGQWEGIFIKVGSKKYFVYTFSTTLPTPKTVGKVDEVGRTVRVFYTRIDRGDTGYDGDLRATRIVEIKKRKLSTR